MQLDLDQYVPGLLLWLSNKVSSSASAIYHEKFGIGVTEWRVLAYFKIYPWSTASRACELMGLDKGAVSRSIGTLVEVNISNRDRKVYARSSTASLPEAPNCTTRSTA